MTIRLTKSEIGFQIFLLNRMTYDCYYEISFSMLQNLLVNADNAIVEPVATFKVNRSNETLISVIYNKLYTSYDVDRITFLFNP